MLNAETIWNLESDSETDLNVKFQERTSEDDSCDHSTLQNMKKRATKPKKISPTKLTPDKLMITFGDKTTTITNTYKQVSSKTVARKAPEPRGTPKPL